LVDDDHDIRALLSRCRLRKRIEVDPDDPRWVITAWGVGYRFSP